MAQVQGSELNMIIAGADVTVKCRTAIKVLFRYINSCLSINLDSL
jgi:hypothetical protein